jgi:hypothetical protein
MSEQLVKGFRFAKMSPFLQDYPEAKMQNNKS